VSIESNRITHSVTEPTVIGTSLEFAQRNSLEVKTDLARIKLLVNLYTKHWIFLVATYRCELSKSAWAPMLPDPPASLLGWLRTALLKNVPRISFH
jgi:hypothetical protein